MTEDLGGVEDGDEPDDDDEELDEEAEVDILLKQIRFRDDTPAPIR